MASTFQKLNLTVAASSLALIAAGQVFADALPTEVPNGTVIVIGDQNEQLQTLMTASGEQDRLSSKATYANFLGGPAILEAFRADALDVATVGNVPPIQAQAAGQEIPIVAAVKIAETDYEFAVRPGLKIDTLEQLKGKKIAYAEGSGRQAFVLNALKAAGLTRDDVELIPLRVADFPDAIRTGQVDVASLNEPHYSRYLSDYKDQQASAIPHSQHDRLPRGVSYLYAGGDSLKNPAKAAAIRDFVAHFVLATQWQNTHPAEWVDAYYVKGQHLTKTQGDAIVASQGKATLPSLTSLIPYQQSLIDVIYDAGDLPKRLDAKAEFDIRFDEVIAQGEKSN
ncbi:MULTISPECIES: ABC transporter substrate-binding protein [unclassified Rhizobium]